MALRRVGMGRGMAGGLIGGLSSGVAGGAFSPDDIAGLAFWLRADLGLYTDTAGTTPVTADGDLVAAWADQVTAGLCIQATSGLRPAYKVNIRNSLPVVRFDSSDDLLDGTLSGLGGNLSKTAFVVATAPVTSDHAHFMLGAAGNAFGLATSAGKFRCFQWANDLDGPAASNNGGWHLVTGKKSGDDLTLYRDGSSIAGPTTKSTVNIGSTNMRIGNLAGGTWPLGGDIAELLVYSGALSDTNRGLIEAYLIARYAL